MIPGSIPEVLSLSAEETLGSMFFTPILGPYDASGQQSHVRVRICLLGGCAAAGHSDSAAPGGHLDVEVSREAAYLIARNFLAAEQGSVPDHRVNDVLCELTNIICGNTMSALASKPGFSLLSPEIIRSDGESWPQSESFHKSFELEQGWLTVRLVLTKA
jgi:hypothetical protein